MAWAWYPFVEYLDSLGTPDPSHVAEAACRLQKLVQGDLKGLAGLPESTLGLGFCKAGFRLV